MVPLNIDCDDMDDTGLVLSRPGSPRFRRLASQMGIMEAIDTVRFLYWMHKTGAYTVLHEACVAMYENEYNTYCYFIGNSSKGFVKIGVTNDPMRRLSEIRTGNPYPVSLFCVVPGDETIEAMLHQAFGALRMEGEWFKITPALRAFILASAEEYMSHLPGTWNREREEQRVKNDVVRLLLWIAATVLFVWTSTVIAVYTLILYLLNIFA